MFKNKIKHQLYKIVVLFFYFIGDIACKINSEFAGELYQKSMRMSVTYDEKIGWWWWELPLSAKKKINL